MSIFANNLRLLRTLFANSKSSRNCSLCANVFINRRTNYNGDNSEFMRQFSTSMPRYAAHFKPRDRKELLKSVIKDDEGTEGEHSITLDAVINTKADMFTDEKTPNMLFNGIPFKEIPFISIRCSKNNTFVVLSDYKGKTITSRSCGAEGFKNCRKGTNVAGQSTAIYISSKAVRMGFKDVRIKVSGLGPGRMAAIKGLQMGGLNIISITDDTRVSFRMTARPRKAKRL